MNWLAHVFLSDAEVEHRLGNLLADLVRGEARARMSPQFLQGVQRHLAIDSFTDAHPLVRRSRARLSAAHRRFSGVLVDVFYDHLLARSWSTYSRQSLSSFTAEFYAEATHAQSLLPDDARVTLGRIIQHDVLGSYRELSGVETSLRRLSLRLAARWRRPFALEQATDEFAAHLDEFAADFAEFFPELQEQVRGR